jgi:hypothetical protein
MFKRSLPLLMILSLAAGAAHAQMTGEGQGQGSGGGGAGGHGHGGHKQPSGDSTTPAAPPPAPVVKPPKPENQIEIVGVVKAIDPDGKRITIAYEAVDELLWPRGTMAFGVYKSDLLKTVTVGEKVRFSLDSQQITTLRPY